MEYLSYVHPAIYWTAVLVLLATIVLHFAWRARRAPTPPLRDRVTPLPPGVAEPDADKTASTVSRPDRRRAGRRGGPLTVVEVTGVPGGESVEGVVVDRSPNGLSVASDGQYPDGTTLYLRPEGVGDACPWVAVVVRNCRGREDYYLLGVEFEPPPPVGVRLQFG